MGTTEATEASWWARLERRRATTVAILREQRDLLLGALVDLRARVEALEEKARMVVKDTPGLDVVVTARLEEADLEGQPVVGGWRPCAWCGGENRPRRGKFPMTCGPDCEKRLEAHERAVRESAAKKTHLPIPSKPPEEPYERLVEEE